MAARLGRRRPRALIDAVNTLQSQSSSCPSSISQAAAVAALTGDETFVRRSVAAYRERRDLIHGLLADVDGLTPVRPDGSFYLFVNCAGLLGRTTPDGATSTTDNDVVLFLLDHASVATIPGSAYGAQPVFPRVLRRLRGGAERRRRRHRRRRHHAALTRPHTHEGAHPWST